MLHRNSRTSCLSCQADISVCWRPDLARALVPRSITVALALPIAAQLGAPAPIVAAGVCLTGLLGANFAQALLNRFGFSDPIARGLATAGSAHGLGTAALARKCAPCSLYNHPVLYQGAPNRTPMCKEPPCVYGSRGLNHYWLG